MSHSAPALTGWCHYCPNATALTEYYCCLAIMHFSLAYYTQKNRKLFEKETDKNGMHEEI